MSNQLELVCTEGALSGESVLLPTDAKLLIGRSKRGLHLVDPLVSIEHAEIEFKTDRYFITDLGSLSGTFLDERRLGREAASLLPGQTLKIGESVFTVQEYSKRPAWFFPLIGGTAVIAAIILYVFFLFLQPVSYEPMLTSPTPVRHDGIVESELHIPENFIRTTGWDDRDMFIRRVTDFDGDKTDEIWIEGPNKKFVVTFDAGNWQIIGEIPTVCRDRNQSFGGQAGFPDQKCGGVLWVFTDGRYQPVAQEGVIAWMRLAPASDGSVAPGPMPFRVTMVDPDRLAGFLSARHIEEPIHYLICEAALPGLSAQVLTASGKLIRLDYGCIREISVLGDDPYHEVTGDVAAVAFTDAGRHALIEDLTTWVSGSRDGLFVDGPMSQTLAKWSDEPSERQVIRVGFVGTNLPSQPIAPEKAILGSRTLLSTASAAAAPTAGVEPLIGEELDLDPPGCASLKVQAISWHCVLAHFCMPDRPAVRVTQVGCGRDEVILEAPFVSGVYDGGDADVQVRIRIDSHPASGQVDVQRALVGWREIPKAEPTPP